MFGLFNNLPMFTIKIPCTKNEHRKVSRLNDEGIILNLKVKSKGMCFSSGKYNEMIKAETDAKTKIKKAIFRTYF